MQVFLVHGEYSAQQVLAGLIRERFGFKVFIPDYLEETLLKPGEELKRTKYPEKAAPRTDWTYLLGEMETRMAQIRDRQKKLEARSWAEQTEIRDKLTELNRSITEIISEI
jgi:metallo-beta-lactamase family protein